MQILEYPYIIISFFVLCFIALLSIGIYFAVKGVKAANLGDENDFITINKMENDFKKSSKQLRGRSILYIGVASDNLGDISSEENVLNDIKMILFNIFSDGVNSSVSIRSEKNYIVFTSLDSKSLHNKLEVCQTNINKCLVKHSAINNVSVRIGGYFSVGTEVTFDEAINRAKQACMLAKNEKIFFAQWDVSSGKALEKRIRIENNIENEIDNNNFFLVYQPVLEAKTKKIIGAEVLARLNSESEGVLTPGSFLSAVDSRGIQEKFDYYIFEKNCKWVSNNKNQREEYKYTINFSRSTLSDPAFAEKIISIAESYGLKLSCLAVEVLEDKPITGDAERQMIDNLALLKEKGVSILLDDFGSGYTTFGDLQNLDISIVKIDKSITQSATTENGFIILKNIINTANAIGFMTLCEGVETKEQEEAALKAGCDLLQGFYYYKPMSVSKLEEIFDNESGGI